MQREGIPDLDLFLVKNVKGVPADGRYHVILAGTIHSSFASEKKARAAYRELRDRLVEETGFATGHVRPQPEDVLRRRIDELGVREEIHSRRKASIKRKINKGRSRTFG